MLALGESGRFEFKSDVRSVDSKLLAALANWVALAPERGVAHLLVGVAERKDETTGLVFGEPCGLANGLDRTVSRIQDVASQTRPIPVDVFIIEEAVDEPVPFVRVEVRPTMPPHYDDEGRRQTRQGRSTRALTDEELLSIYLDRESGSFAARFRQTTEDLASAVGAVSSQVDQIAMAIQQTIAQPIADLSDTATYAAISASSAEAAAESVADDVRHVEDLVRELNDVVQEMRDNAPESLAARVVRQRRAVWWSFTTDTWKRSSRQAERLAKRLHAFLSTDIALDDAENTWELRIWEDLLTKREDQRSGRGSLKWWGNALLEVNSFLKSPSYQAPELPDMRAELRADFDKALDDPESATYRFVDLLED